MHVIFDLLHPLAFEFHRTLLNPYRDNVQRVNISDQALWAFRPNNLIDSCMVPSKHLHSELVRVTRHKVQMLDKHMLRKDISKDNGELLTFMQDHCDDSIVSRAVKEGSEPVC